MSDWSVLACNYFASTCRRMLTTYLEEHGFKERRETPGGGLVFTKLDLFIELNYDLSRFPNYSIVSSIGFGEGAHVVTVNSVAYNGLPMWYILPSSHPYNTEFDSWEFLDKSELEKVLVEVKRDYLEKVLHSLLDNRDALERAIERFRSEFPFE